MDDGVKLKVRGDLLKALDVEPTDGMKPAPELVVAAALQRLAIGRGLAQRDDDLNHSVVRNAGLPLSVLAMLDAMFGADGEPACDDDLRNGLYEELLSLSEDTRALQVISKTRSISGLAMLEFAQIYWNLDAQEPRRRLPIPVGQQLTKDRQAYIKVDGVDRDYAALDLQRRAKHTPGYSSGGSGFHQRGARIAALVANRLVDRTAPDVSGAKLRPTRTERGNEWDIVWEAAAPAPSSGSRASSSVGSVDPMIGGLHQLRSRSMAEGDLGAAASLGNALIEILQERSEKNPGDHESQLADEYLQSGLVSATRGRAEEALEHLHKAESASRMLSELNPGEATYRLQLAIVRTMVGVLHLQAGRSLDAEAALDDAVGQAQALTDEDAGNEDLLSLSLGMFGLLCLQTGQMERAMTAFTRAVTIAQKIVKQNPGARSNQLQLANMLNGLGVLHFHQDDQQHAEECLTRSLAMLEGQTYRGFEGRMARLLRASSQMMLGTIYFYSDRYDEAEAALTASISLGRELVDERPEEAVQLSLASALHTLGLLYTITEREQDGENTLLASIAVSRELMASQELGLVDSAQFARASTYLGSALYFLGLLYLGIERDQKAETVLVEAVRVFEQRVDDAGDQKMLVDAVESLAALYRRHGREAEAERILSRRRRFDDQNPDSPALA